MIAVYGMTTTTTVKSDGVKDHYTTTPCLFLPTLVFFVVMSRHWYRRWLGRTASLPHWCLVVVGTNNGPRNFWTIHSGCLCPHSLTRYVCLYCACCIVKLLIVCYRFLQKKLHKLSHCTDIDFMHCNPYSACAQRVIIIWWRSVWFWNVYVPVCYISSKHSLVFLYRAKHSSSSVKWKATQWKRGLH